METCYKVVKKLNLRYYSITSDGLEYVPGMTMTAPVICSENEFISTDFFVFKDLGDAEDFKKFSCSKDCDILTCQTDRLRKMDFVTEIDPIHIKNFWKENHGHYYQRSAPKGTYCCRTLFVQSVYVKPEERASDFAELFCETLNELLKTHPLTINSLLSSRVYIEKETIPEKFKNINFNNTLNILGIINHCLDKLYGKHLYFTKRKDRQELITKYFLDK